MKGLNVSVPEIIVCYFRNIYQMLRISKSSHLFFAKQLHGQTVGENT